MKKTSSHKSTNCPACGESLPDDSPQGLCAACLMAGALEQTLADAPAETGGESPRPPSPDIKNIRETFPQFEVLELIGAGGMGSVYKARQPKLDRTVALKILSVADKDERFAERFEQEARTLARLSHPNIVTVFDYGETDGLYFLLMEFVEGLNLRQIMGASRLAPAQALAIVPPICEALQYAHDLGIVHRDIKPDNILMDRSGRVKIADFGIARLLENAREEVTEYAPDHKASASSLTREMILGTPNYMAPEQGTDPEKVDHRADIYSLGVVFYEMLTGERPGPALTPPSERVEVDVRLDEVVLRALARQPELRFQSADEFTKTLSGVMTAPDTPGGQVPATGTSGTSLPSKRRPWITVGAALLVFGSVMIFHGFAEILLMALAGAIAFAWCSRHPIPPSSPFSKAGRVLLSAAAIPVVFFAVVTFSDLVASNTDRTEYANELIPPESRTLTLHGQTVVAVDDGLRTHYVFHYDGGMTSVRGMSQGGGRRERPFWDRTGTLELPSGQRIEYQRDSSNLPALNIDNQTWDLRNGAVFQIGTDGSIVQRALYPPLLSEENLDEWLETIRE